MVTRQVQSTQTGATHTLRRDKKTRRHKDDRGGARMSTAPVSQQLRESAVLHRVEREIQFEHVYARFTENAELAARLITVDEHLHVGRLQIACYCDTRDLISGRGKRDLRVQTSARR